MSTAQKSKASEIKEVVSSVNPYKVYTDIRNGVQQYRAGKVIQAKAAVAETKYQNLQNAVFENLKRDPVSDVITVIRAKLQDASDISSEYSKKAERVQQAEQRYREEVTQVSKEGTIGKNPSATFDRRETAIDELERDRRVYQKQMQKQFEMLEEKGGQAQLDMHHLLKQFDKRIEEWETKYHQLQAEKQVAFDEYMKLWKEGHTTKWTHGLTPIFDSAMSLFTGGAAVYMTYPFLGPAAAGVGVVVAGISRPIWIWYGEREAKKNEEKERKKVAKLTQQ